ncbi:uncharacterized protein LODBEIA_P42290 [Lodderomyces beijingensis]|uniref:Guanine nucleotide-exchange factor SEC12 n=1 Tax=Lodderomyces beijingensis TaxID=1775926 RepID=A0ABP0ZUZ5_9ASCO
MSLKESVSIDVGYPIMGAKFVNNKTILVTGGGGEGNNGIPNKITAVKCSFKVKDSKRKLQKFREVQLPSNEDSPQCIDTTKLVDEGEFNVVIGCNQSSQLIKSMSINNNVRKYSYNKDEHLTFVDAAQFEEAINGDAEEYPKIIKLAQDNSVGCMMTSSVPSVIYFFNPNALELKFKYIPEQPVEIKDFALSPRGGETFCYITSDSIVTLSTKTNMTTFTSKANIALSKQLQNFVLSKVRFISNEELLIAASGKDGKGAVLFKYKLSTQKIVQEQQLSKKFNNVVAIDLSISQDLVALAGNDLSVTLVKLSNLKVLHVFKKLHPFAITSVAFSPNGNKLATGSAANILHVVRIPPNYASGKSLIGTLLQYLFTIILVLALGIGIQKGRENGQLNELMQYSGQYSEVGLEYAKVGYQLAEKYGKIGYDIAQVYIEDYAVKAKEYAHKALELYEEFSNKDKVGTETASSTSSSADAAVDSAPAESTLNDIVTEVTKDVEHITGGPNFNSEQFFEEEIVTQSIISKDKTLSSTKVETETETETVSSSPSTTIASKASVEPIQFEDSQVEPAANDTAIDAELSQNVSDTPVVKDKQVEPEVELPVSEPVDKSAELPVVESSKSQTEPQSSTFTDDVSTETEVVVEVKDEDEVEDEVVVEVEVEDEVEDEDEFEEVIEEVYETGPEKDDETKIEQTESQPTGANASADVHESPVLSKEPVDNSVESSESPLEHQGDSDTEVIIEELLQEYETDEHTPFSVASKIEESEVPEMDNFDADEVIEEVILEETPDERDLPEIPEEVAQTQISEATIEDATVEKIPENTSSDASEQVKEPSAANLQPVSSSIEVLVASQEIVPTEEVVVADKVETEEVDEEPSRSGQSESTVLVQETVVEPEAEAIVVDEPKANTKDLDSDANANAAEEKTALASGSTETSSSPASASSPEVSKVEASSNERKKQTTESEKVEATPEEPEPLPIERDTESQSEAGTGRDEPTPKPQPVEELQEPAVKLSTPAASQAASSSAKLQPPVEEASTVTPTKKKTKKVTRTVTKQRVKTSNPAEKDEL